jgi:glycosyltransferase involved in cell wall biosynthesis
LIRVISVVSNDIVTDNRVHKIALSLISEGFDVVVTGRLLKNSQKLNERNYSVRRFKLIVHKGPLFYLCLNLRIFFYLLGASTDIILSNDLDTLPACWMASRLKKKRLVFDSHELFPEVPELVHRPFVRSVWRKLEKFLIPRIDFGFTVCQPIASFYEQKYGVHFEVISNMGRYRHNHDFKGIMKNHALRTIIYQGSVNLGRGLELAIRSLAFLKDTRFWIVGDGDVTDDLKQLVAKEGLWEKVIFIGRVPVEGLWNYTVKADLGISLEEDLGLNYRYALPNKLFDYIQARIPVVVSDLPEMATLVRNYAIGEILTERTPEKLAEVINGLLNRYAVTEKPDPSFELAASELCWEMEEKKLIILFKRAAASA